jgi:hypothetical protein
MDHHQADAANKPHGVRRANDRRVLNEIFWVLRSGAPWRYRHCCAKRAIAQRRGRPTKLGDDEDVPLLCPTRQRQLRVFGIDGCLLLCMGLFSIFLYRGSPP